MNYLVCLLATLAIITAPGDFAVNRTFLLLLFTALVLLHHFVKGRPWYYRASEYLLLGAVFTVWFAGFFTPHYFLLQPLINGALMLHAISAVVYYWPTEAEQKQQAYSVLFKAAPWLLVAMLAQWKAAEWLPQVTKKEKTLPNIVVPKSDTIVLADTTTKAINLFERLSQQGK